ncbi:MAG: VWA domain-containing protein [Planctomycetes bacterium]|nr:VWA domain-containing protein [Planctomycetota bacterium]
MTLLTPMIGAIAALIVVPALLALYMLKLRRTRREISSTLLWKSQTEDLRANTLFQRLRLSPLFLLQCLILLLLAAALMQPMLKGWAKPSGRVVMLIDQSASMQTRDASDGRTRLEQAKQLAAAQVDSWQGGGLFASSPPEVMVISFAEDASVRIPFSTSAARIREAIEAIEPTDQVTRIAPAIALARAFASEQASEQDQALSAVPAVEIVSDGNIPDLAQLALRKGEEFTWIRCGSSDTVNQGLSAVGAERRGEDAAQVYAFAALRNDSDAPAQRSVQVRSNGTLIASSPEPVAIPAATGKGASRMPGEQKMAFSPFTLPSAGVLGVSLQPGDAFETDDHASIAIQEQQTLKLLLAGSDPALESLLDSLPSVALQQMSGEALAKRMVAEPEWTESFDVIVTVGCDLPALTAGRWLIFGKPPPIAGLNAYGEQPRQAARAWKSDHKAMAQSQFADLVVDKAAAIAPSSEWTALLEGSKGPLIVSGRSANATVIYAAFAPMDSNWPFQRSFVNFTAQAVEFLGALGSAVASESLEPGAMLRTRIPKGSTKVVVMLPSGARVAQNPLEGEVAYGPLRLAGVYRVEYIDPAGKQKSRAVAVNLTDAAECDVAAARQLALPGGELQPKSAGWSTLAVWPLVVAAVLALMMIEWWLYHRSGATR